MASRTITTVASELVPANASRKSLIFQNEDSTDIAYIKIERSESTTVSATDHDHKIGPGGTISLDHISDGIEQVQARWTVIASANTPRLSFFETENIKR